MGVNHRRRDVTMTQQLLNRSDIRPGHQHVCRKGMPQRVRRHRLGHGSPHRSPLHQLLHTICSHMMTPDLLGPRIFR